MHTQHRLLVTNTYTHYQQVHVKPVNVANQFKVVEVALKRIIPYIIGTVLVHAQCSENCLRCDDEYIRPAYTNTWANSVYSMILNEKWLKQTVTTRLNKDHGTALCVMVWYQRLNFLCCHFSNDGGLYFLLYLQEQYIWMIATCTVFLSHNLKVIKNYCVQILLVVAVGQSLGFLLSVFCSSVFHKVQMQIYTTV